MTITSGSQQNKDKPLHGTSVAVLAEKTYSKATFRWTYNQQYPAATSPNGHKWQGFYTPEEPPRNLVIQL